MRPAKKGFLNNFTVREDRLVEDGFIISVLGGIALASAASWMLSSTPAAQHAYLDWIFWPLTAAPVLGFVLIFLLPTWLRRRKTWFPVPGS